jgi:hypothetical protein
MEMDCKTREEDCQFNGIGSRGRLCWLLGFWGISAKGDFEGGYPQISSHSQLSEALIIL